MEDEAHSTRTVRVYRPYQGIQHQTETGRCQGGAAGSVLLEDRSVRSFFGFNIGQELYNIVLMLANAHIPSHFVRHHSGLVAGRVGISLRAHSSSSSSIFDGNEGSIFYALS